MDMTFIISDELIEVSECREPGAHLLYYSDGITFYTIGTSKFHHPDCVRNLAMNALETRHIPVITLRDPNYKRPGKKQIFSETSDMFGGKK